jgi:hypothetical protein
MTKFVIALMFSLVGLNAYATPGFVGSWCQVNSDFTGVLIIKDDGQAISFAVGNQAGEVVPPVTGFVNSGAGNFQIILNGVDIGAQD